MLELRICLDVDDMEKALSFYTRVFALSVSRRFDPDWVELAGAPVPIDLLRKPSGSPAAPGSGTQRDYRRHWTPAHLDFVVEDIEQAVRRAQAAGAHLEGEIREQAYGRLALMADPFGHGFCFLEFQGRGYGEIQEASPKTAADGNSTH